MHLQKQYTREQPVFVFFYYRVRRLIVGPDITRLHPSDKSVYFGMRAPGRAMAVPIQLGGLELYTFKRNGSCL